MKREIAFDVISGIFILRMVYSHICMFAEYHDHTWLTGITGMFLMWFFFKGGFLTKDSHDVYDVTLHSFHKLCKPFMYLTLFAIICDTSLYLFDMLYGGGKYYSKNEIIQTIGSLMLNGAAHGNMPVWFLLSYFFVKLLFTYQQCRPINKTSVLYLPIVCLSIPFLLHFCNFRYPYYLANIFLGLYGFYIGYIYKLVSINAKREYIFIVSCILYIGTYLLFKPSLDIRTNTLYSGYYLLWAIWSVSGCVFFYYVMRNLKWFSSLLQIIGLAKVGEMSMSILVIHWPILLIGDYIRKVFLSVPNEYFLFYYVGIVLLFIPPVHYLIKHSKLKFLIGS